MMDSLRDDTQAQNESARQDFGIDPRNLDFDEQRRTAQAQQGAFSQERAFAQGWQHTPFSTSPKSLSQGHHHVSLKDQGPRSTRGQKYGLTQGNQLGESPRPQRFSAPFLQSRLTPGLRRSLAQRQLPEPYPGQNSVDVQTCQSENVNSQHLTGWHPLSPAGAYHGDSSTAYTDDPIDAPLEHPVGIHTQRDSQSLTDASTEPPSSADSGQHSHPSAQDPTGASSKDAGRGHALPKTPMSIYSHHPAYTQYPIQTQHHGRSPYLTQQNSVDGLDHRFCPFSTEAFDPSRDWPNECGEQLITGRTHQDDGYLDWSSREIAVADDSIFRPSMGLQPGKPSNRQYSNTGNNPEDCQDEEGQEQQRMSVRRTAPVIHTVFSPSGSETTGITRQNVTTQMTPFIRPSRRLRKPTAVHHTTSNRPTASKQRRIAEYSTTADLDTLDELDPGVDIDSITDVDNGGNMDSSSDTERSDVADKTSDADETGDADKFGDPSAHDASIASPPQTAADTARQWLVSLNPQPEVAQRHQIPNPYFLARNVNVYFATKLYMKVHGEHSNQGSDKPRSKGQKALPTSIDTLPQGRDLLYFRGYYGKHPWILSAGDLASLVGSSRSLVSKREHKAVKEELGEDQSRTFFKVHPLRDGIKDRNGSLDMPSGYTIPTHLFSSRSSVTWSSAAQRIHDKLETASQSIVKPPQVIMGDEPAGQTTSYDRIPEDPKAPLFKSIPPSGQSIKAEIASKQGRARKNDRLKLTGKRPHDEIGEARQDSAPESMPSSISRRKRIRAEEALRTAQPRQGRPKRRSKEHAPSQGSGLRSQGDLGEEEEEDNMAQSQPDTSYFRVLPSRTLSSHQIVDAQSPGFDARDQDFMPGHADKRQGSVLGQISQRFRHLIASAGGDRDWVLSLFVARKLAISWGKIPRSPVEAEVDSLILVFNTNIRFLPPGYRPPWQL